MKCVLKRKKFRKFRVLQRELLKRIKTQVEDCAASNAEPREKPRVAVVAVTAVFGGISSMRPADLTLQRASVQQPQLLAAKNGKEHSMSGIQSDGIFFFLHSQLKRSA